MELVCGGGPRSQSSSGAAWSRHRKWSLFGVWRLGGGGGLLGNTRITRVQAPSNSNKNIMIKVSGFNQCNTQHIPISSYLMLTLILVSASIRLVFLSSFTSFFFSFVLLKKTGWCRCCLNFSSHLTNRTAARFMEVLHGTAAHR